QGALNRGCIIRHPIPKRPEPQDIVDRCALVAELARDRTRPVVSDVVVAAEARPVLVLHRALRRPAWRPTSTPRRRDLRPVVGRIVDAGPRRLAVEDPPLGQVRPTVLDLVVARGRETRPTAR